MITSAMQTDEIKIQAKAERNVERKLLLNEERKTDATVKKDNFEGNDDLVVSRKIFNNTHGNDKKKSTAKYNKTKNNIVKGKKEGKQELLRFYLQKQLEKKISKWLMFVETEITFLGLLLINCSLMNLTMNK